MLFNLLVFKILPCFVAVFQKGPDILATVHFGAFAASIVLLAIGALADFAQIAAIIGFHAFVTAAQAVDVFGQDFNIVQFAPLVGDLFSQIVVVVYRCDAGFTLLAIQPAKCYHFVHFQFVVGSSMIYAFNYSICFWLLAAGNWLADSSYKV